MQIVIDIPEEYYKDIYSNTEIMIYGGMRSGKTYLATLLRAIRNGTPLPKKHGRIGDLDSIMNDICNSINEMTNIGISVDGQYLWAKLNDAVDNASTIIPADTDKESEE